MTLVNHNMQLQEIANGVIYQSKFYPYQTRPVNSSAAGADFTGSVNTRFYIKQVVARVRTVAGDTGTYMIASCKIRNVQVYFLTLDIVPSVAQRIFEVVPVGLLTDPMTTIYTSVDVNITAAALIITYAEIDDI